MTLLLWMAISYVSAAIVFVTIDYLIATIIFGVSTLLILSFLIIEATLRKKRGKINA